MTGFNLPEVIFGTSGLGNLYVALEDSVKLAIVEESIASSAKPVVFDTAGKYGAGLSLECLGKCLKQSGVAPKDVLISNKLGWLRTELKTEEPTFEPGVWKGLKYDAVQNISYEGILQCYKQGNQLLNGYSASLVSVHDPDEYLLAAADDDDRAKRYLDILDAYRALADLKQKGEVKAIGVGAKDWKVIQKITKDVELDWVMIANSMTIHSHPPELIRFMEELEARGITIINSAVFNAGFLTGGDFYNYRPIDLKTDEGKGLIAWRDCFNAICNNFGIKPAVACVQFALSAPGVTSIALNTTDPARVKQNVAMAATVIPMEFWRKLSAEGLISVDYLPLIINRSYKQKHYLHS
ncbi:aldo/keto reductase [Mucilaginibacter sp. ZT4R22]|uniref:Aldo/keto reductase n=1 Tax=Mucilaginibacter pankratovii TaxID=2772110 RepID=A0ABR7WP66_9SPHI|nr:aldo/keto reductase [Mucilaginibacter pankratovii]MBD1363154.1 aldo/keto reductase [Mucilaginibacter pankratovii]